MSALFTGDTVQNGTGKVDPARKFKCTTRLPVIGHQSSNISFSKYLLALRVLYC